MSHTNRLRLEMLESRVVPAGDLVYAHLLTGLPADVMTRVAADPAGNVYVTGTFSGTIDLDPRPAVDHKVTARGGTDVFVAKYSVDGQLVWAQTTEGLANESVTDVATDGIGNVFLSGTFTGAVDFDPDPQDAAIKTGAAGGSAFVWKLDNLGKHFGAWAVEGTSSASSIDVDQAGNIIVTGSFTGSADFDPSQATSNLTTASATGTAFAWRLDQLGNYSWALPFHSTGNIELSTVQIDGQGFAYVAGRFTGTADLDPTNASKALVASGTFWTPFVTKIGGAGDYVWGRSLRVISQPAGTSASITGLGVDGIGNVYLGGSFGGSIDFDPGAGNTTLASTGNSMDGFAWKLDFNGNLGYARRFGGAEDETVSDVGLDQAGNMYLTGTFTGIGDFDPGAAVAKLGSGSGASDAYVLKLSPQGGLVYTRAIGGSFSTTQTSGIFADGAGNMYLSGGFSGRADFDPGLGITAVMGGTGSGFITKLYAPVTAPPKLTNLPPTNLSAGGPYKIKEADPLTVKAMAVDPEGRPLFYSWDLNGDGIFGDAIGKKVTINSAKMSLLGLRDGTGETRVVRVRVGDGVNLAVEATTTLTIENLPPTIKLIVPPTSPEGVRPFVFYKIVAETAGKDRKAGYRSSWDFNGDGTWDLGNGTTYAGSVLGKKFKIPAGMVADAGPLAVRVRVFDKDGDYTEQTAALVIAEMAPKASFGTVGLVRSGVPTKIAFAGIIDSPNDLAAGFTYEFDFDNDGIFETKNGKNKQATVTFPAPGHYIVRGKVIDQDGMATIYLLPVTVSF